MASTTDDFWDRCGDAYPRTSMIVACAILGVAVGGFGSGLWDKSQGYDPVAGLLSGAVVGGLCGAAIGALFALPTLVLSLLGLFFLVGFVRWAWAWWS